MPSPSLGADPRAASSLLVAGRTGFGGGRRVVSRGCSSARSLSRVARRQEFVSSADGGAGPPRPASPHLSPLGGARPARAAPVSATRLPAGARAANTASRTRTRKATATRFPSRPRERRTRRTLGAPKRTAGLPGGWDEVGGPREKGRPPARQAPRARPAALPELPGTRDARRAAAPAAAWCLGQRRPGGGRPGTGLGTSAGIARLLVQKCGRRRDVRVERMVSASVFDFRFAGTVSFKRTKQFSVIP